MRPLVLITTHPDFPPLIVPLADAWELDLIVAPRWAAGTAIPHHGLVVYDPQRTIPLDTLVQHPRPLLGCVHRDPNAQIGGPPRSRLPQPRHIHHVITPFDHAEVYLLGLRIFFPDHWRFALTTALPTFPPLAEQWAMVAYPDRLPKPPETSA